MNNMKRLIPLMLLGGVLLITVVAQAGTTETSAGSGIVSVTFQRNGEKTLRADAILRAPSETVWQLIRNVEHYPSLVPWVEESRGAVGSRDPEHQFYMALRLPWPVGRIWNVVQLEDVDYQTLRWNMVSGTIKENAGYVRVEAAGNLTRVIYESRVDIGYPTWLTDPIEKSLIRQFLAKLQIQACTVVAQGKGGTSEPRSC